MTATVAVESGGLSQARSGAQRLPAAKMPLQKGVGTHLQTTHRVQNQNDGAVKGPLSLLEGVP